MRHLSTPLALTSILAASLAVLGCAASQTRHNQELVTQPLDRTVVLVENRNWQQVEVYLAIGAAQRRLGFVDPMSSTRFEVTAPIGSMARMAVRPVGSRARFTTDGVHVASAGWLDLIITSDASRSILTAR